MMRIQSFLLLLPVFLLSSCVSKPIAQVDGLYKAQWETKALIKNLSDDKTRSLNIDIYAIRNERARFEISGLLGFQVASLVMSPTEISYILHTQKTFYYGKNSEKAFKHLIDLPLHPMNLAKIAFDEPIQGPGWKCDYADMKISQCENSQNQIRVLWADRKDGQKKVLISAPHFEMKWQFVSTKTEVQFKPELFTLKQPSGFKAIQIK